jgi:hypothetical protein
MDEYLDIPSFDSPDLSLDDALEFAEEYEPEPEASTYDLSRL